ncbi:FG-GAP repeat protein [Gloeocapsa sp. PCC 73106]|uniref:FG-GAP repeat protein n=1 Tax=Gloeocapsa sp. PCC 73106 TaxID=102232 RepID=UPI0002ACDF2C|nr:FG-GAP repeat protein [Gloeocapsa sp. PCC 73106]ELR97345.1 hypothetical protein GLO73106DRAFT_00011540 [Gloeocapsa sp. PCC 73106]
MITTVLITIWGYPKQVHSQINDSLRIDKITPEDVSGGDSFGFAVAVKNDYGLIGAPYQDNSGVDTGAVYLFDLSTNKQIRKLTVKEEKEGDLFGYAVSLSDEYALIGQPYTDQGAIDGGGAHLFALDSLRYPKQLTTEDLKEGDLFGYAVAVSDQYALVSAPYQDTRGVDSGVVYLFDVTTGKQLRKLTPRDGNAGDLFGYSVAIAPGYALIGAPYRDERGVDSGAVYWFDLETGEQLAKLVPTDGANAGDLFGYSVAIAPGYALIGAPYRDSVGTDAGSVYLFDLNTGAQINKIEPQDLAAGDVYGHSLAFFGNALLVGAPYQDRGGLDTGGAYLSDFAYKNQVPQNVEIQSQPGDLLGYAVGGAQDFALIGAPYGDDFGADSGVVYRIQR